MIRLEMKNSMLNEEKIAEGRVVKVIKGSVSAMDNGVRQMSNGRNVRSANTRSKVAREIRDTALNNPYQMVFKNRGITAFIEGEYDYKPETNILEAENIYIIDGGTTKTICDELYADGELVPECVLNLEVMATNTLSPREIISISSSRNTNNPPADFTLADVSGAFDNMKKEIYEEYLPFIEFRQNKHIETGDSEYLKCEEFIRCLMMLDARRYYSFDNKGEDKFPNHKSNDASKAMDDLKNGTLSYDFMTPILNDVLELRDMLFVDLTNRLEAWALSDSKELHPLLRFANLKTKNYKAKDIKELLFTPCPKKKYNAIVKEVKETILSKSYNFTLFTKEGYKFNLPKQVAYVYFSALRANIRLSGGDGKAYWHKKLRDIQGESFNYLWDRLIKESIKKPGGGMDVLCTPEVAKDIYMNIQTLVLS